MLYLKLSTERRKTVQRMCLRFAFVCLPFTAVFVANYGDRPSVSTTVLALGLIAAIPLVAGIVLYVAGRAAKRMSREDEGPSGV